MKITVPQYILDSVLRHYEALSRAYRYDGDNKACNAARVAAKEIRKLRGIIEKQKHHGISHIDNTPQGEDADERP